MDTTYRIPINSRVRLRDGIDPALYKGFSCTGNEGWVRNHRADEHGYPQVLIEWDHDHWSYNGAQNCWTWEEHFDIVEGADMPEKDPDKVNRLKGLADAFIQEVLGQETAQPEAAKVVPVPTPTGVEVPAEPEEDTPVNITAEAIEALGKAKAFVVITVQEDEKDGQRLIYPAIYQQSEDEKWALICQGHIGHLLTLLHDSLLQEKLIKNQMDNQNAE